ncbi:MAG: aminotransferase class IV [Deltaproteobacteria bacterium]|jgi:branched-subunit amino acid aminotransferase/4-amino-4-deoxychorismate lyase|nr:aminotransferase class IV [Deltaproteobacteria bacterium]
MTEPMLVCLNGEFIPQEEARVPINDGGFLFGATLFETFKAQEQKILLVQQHLDRLECSAHQLKFSFARNKIEHSLQQLAAGLTAPTSRIRLTLSQGLFDGLKYPEPAECHFLITATDYSELSDAQRESGAICVTAPNQRVNPFSHLPQMKHGNYADCLYAFNFAQQSGAREALFFDQNKNVLEGATSNIFAVINHRLVSPPTGHLVLDGITRQEVIKTAAELGLPFSQRQIHAEELLQAEEVFLTNSLIDILPVSKINGKVVRRCSDWKSLLKTLWMRIET